MKTINHLDIIERVVNKCKILRSRTEVQLEETLKNKAYIAKNLQECNEEMLPYYEESYKKIEKEVQDMRKTLSKCNKLIQRSNVYSFIIHEVNKRNMEAVYKDAVPYNLGFKLGSVHMIKTKRIKARINWKASFDYRDELKEKGVKLYDKETGEGKKWFIYHDDYYNYKFKWVKGTRRFKNSYGWFMEFIGGPNGYGTKAIRHFRDNPLQSLIHKLYTDGK